MGVINLKHPGFKQYTFSLQGMSGAHQNMEVKDSTLFITGVGGLWLSYNLNFPAAQYSTGMTYDTIIPGPNGFAILHSYDVLKTDDYIFCSTNTGVYRSDFSLSGWQLKNNGLEGKSILEITGTNDNLYARSFDSLYTSTDTGSTWDAVLWHNTPYGNMCMKGTDIYCVHDTAGILVSTDNGASWSQFNQGLNSQDLVVSIKNLEGELYAAVASGDLYQWAGTTWVPVSMAGAISTDMLGLKNIDGEIVAGDSRGIYKLINSNDWESIFPKDSGQYYHMSVEGVGDTIVALSKYFKVDAPSSVDTIKYSYDGGKTWLGKEAPAFQDPLGYSSGTIRYLNGRIYLYARAEIFYADNLNSPWVNITASNLTSSVTNGLEYFQGKVYMINNRVNTLYTLDSLDNWVARYGVLNSGNEISSIFVQDSALFLESNQYIYRRFANSSNWIPVNIGSSPSHVLDYVVDGALLVTAGFSGVSYTFDYGDTWFGLNDSILSNLVPVGIDIKGDSLYVATEFNGVFKHAIPKAPIGLEEDGRIANGVTLYPNPASEYFIIDSPGEGQFSMFNMSAVEVHQGNFRSGEKIYLPRLGEGVYVLRVNADNGRTYTKTVVIER